MMNYLIRQLLTAGSSFLIGMFLTGFLSVATAQQINDSTSIKALLITGGGWHDYEARKPLLIRGLNERIEMNIEWTIIHEGEGDPEHQVSLLKEDKWAQDYDVIVHNVAFAMVTDGDFVRNLVEHHQGTPAVLIHASILSYRHAEPADPWYEFMGLQSTGHDRGRIFTVENVASNHDIMKGFPEKWELPLDDELYVIDKLWGNITPLARAYSIETESYHTVTWTHELNGTRVFCTTLGHHTAMFEQAEFLDKIANGLLWAVGKL